MVYSRKGFSIEFGLFGSMMSVAYVGGSREFEGARALILGLRCGGRWTPYHFTSTVWSRRQNLVAVSYRAYVVVVMILSECRSKDLVIHIIIS